jgi:hypothetical protein
VIGVEEHHVTLMAQLAPPARVLQLLVSLNCPAMIFAVTVVLVLNGLVTVTVPPAQ